MEVLPVTDWKGVVKANEYNGHNHTNKNVDYSSDRPGTYNTNTKRFCKICIMSCCINYLNSIKKLK